MSKKATEFQRKAMSRMYRGKEIFKPLNTGWIDKNVACVREWVANIFFYRKGDTTIMVDAGYNYDRLAEKMSWLGIDPHSIRHILITHQDTDHVGAVEADSRGCSGMRSYTSARSRTGISPARCGEKSSIISINCRRSRSTTKRYCCTMGRYLTLTASGSSVFWFPVIHGDIWSTSLTISTFLPATRCGLAWTAATASFPRWRRTISWLCSHWRSWNGNCAHVGCIHISSPVTLDGRTILPLRLPTKTRAVHHSKNEYTGLCLWDKRCKGLCSGFLAVTRHLVRYESHGPPVG